MPAPLFLTETMLRTECKNPDDRQVSLSPEGLTSEENIPGRHLPEAKYPEDGFCSERDEQGKFALL